MAVDEQPVHTCGRVFCRQPCNSVQQQGNLDVVRFVSRVDPFHGPSTVVNCYRMYRLIHGATCSFVADD